MEILNILYSNNLIAVYLIGAILVVIIILIVISSMSTTSKDNKEILKDPIEEETKPDPIEIKVEEKKVKEEKQDVPKINDIVENLYQKSLETEIDTIEELKDLNSFLEEFEVPEMIIEEVVNNDATLELNEEPKIIENPIIETPAITQNEIEEEIETPRLKNASENKENIEDMLKRLYDLRQNENIARKNALINEIYDLKKQVDETIKSNQNNYNYNFEYINSKALADYFLFNEDIEFPKLK